MTLDFEVHSRDFIVRDYTPDTIDEEITEYIMDVEKRINKRHQEFMELYQKYYEKSK